MADRTPHIVPDILENGEDVTRETDRALVLRAVNTSMRAESGLAALKAGLHLEFAMLRHAMGLPESTVKIDPDSSYNVVSTAFTRAAATLYAQAKDPHNPLTVADVVAIAQGTYATNKRDSDATRLARTGERRWTLWLTILGAALAVVGEALLFHFFGKP